MKLSKFLIAGSIVFSAAAAPLTVSAAQMSIYDYRDFLNGADKYKISLMNDNNIFLSYDIESRMYYDADKKIKISCHKKQSMNERSADNDWFFDIGEDGKAKKNDKLILYKTSNGDYRYFRDRTKISENEYSQIKSKYNSLIEIDQTKGMYINLSEKENSEITVLVGTERDLPVDLIPKNSSELKVSWKSSDTSVVEISDDGKAKGLKSGIAAVKATIDGIDEPICQCKVNVITEKETDNAQESKTDTSVVEESQPQPQNTVRSLIEAGGSEKEIYDKIYALDKYSTAGHVITDVDNDGKYELITRNAERSAIMIYKISGRELLEKKFDDPNLGYNSVRVDMRYSNNGSDVYFTVLGTNDNQFYQMKIFKFTPGQFVMNKTDDVTFSLDEYRQLDFQNMSKPAKSACDKLQLAWTESFNDSCTEGAPSDSVEIPKEEMGTYVNDFTTHYYDQYDIDPDRIVRFSVDDSSDGLSLYSVQTLLLNEIYARHGMKSSYPYSIAFFNKKSYYKELHNPSYFDENVVSSSEFNDFERTAIKTFNYIDNGAGQH